MVPIRPVLVLFPSSTRLAQIYSIPHLPYGTEYANNKGDSKRHLPCGIISRSPESAGQGSRDDQGRLSRSVTEIFSIFRGLLGWMERIHLGQVIVGRSATIGRRSTGYTYEGRLENSMLGLNLTKVHVRRSANITRSSQGNLHVPRVNHAVQMRSCVDLLHVPISNH